MSTDKKEKKMSLTQNDLGHGFLYRRKDDPEAIGRLNFDPNPYDVDTRVHVSWKIGSSVVTTYMTLDDWEGIPITPEILRDWKIGTAFPKNPFYFQVSEIGLKFLDDRCYPDYGREIKYIHQLQRLVLALTHKPLEGGPK